MLSYDQRSVTFMRFSAILPAIEQIEQVPSRFQIWGSAYRGADWSMPQVSAGLLMYRKSGSSVEIFLVHPGGPFWAKKEEGVWSIPKGLVDPGEDKLEAAKREFVEETSIIPSGPFLELGQIRQKSGKQVYAWAFAGNCDPPSIKSNTFTLEWPPRSGRMSEFPEVDRGGFFAIADALRKINPQQAEFVNRLKDRLGKEG